MNTIPITVPVPTGGYCATKDSQTGYLVNECPLLKSCTFENEDVYEPGYYCPLVSEVIGLREDKFGIYKWNSREFVCPSLPAKAQPILGPDFL